jgi:hypothetical protein
MDIFSSEKLSKDDVGSSRIIIFGSLINNLAMASLCLCHQLKRIHLSHISVSNQSLNSKIKSHSAILIIFLISFKDKVLCIQ